MNSSNFKNNPKTLYDLSNRTIQKIILRASLSCSLCGWNKTTCDIHHIIEVSKGGSNEMSNLIYVCPNCHRCIHQLGDSFKTKEQLFELSLNKTFPNWLDFYNPKRERIFKLNNIEHICKNCNKPLPHTKTFCNKKCSGLFNTKPKLEWTIDLIISLLKKHFGILTECGKELGVSDNAFKKQCKKFNIDPKDFKIKYKRK